MTNLIELLFKRGLKANLPASADMGEPLFTTDTNELYVGKGDGVAPVKIGDTSGVSSALTAETAARIAADSAEATTRAAADATEATARANAITSEAASRVSGDAASVVTAEAYTDTSVAAEATTRANAVTSEATTRANADALKAPLASPALTGTPTAPTPSTGDNSTKLATTAYARLAMKAIGVPVFNVKSPDYGAVGDGSTDDSAAVISAIQAAYDAGGGVVYFPAGTYKILSQLTIPNTGGSGPTQPAIRLTGAGPSMASSAAAGGSGIMSSSCLDLQNNAATAKIDTRGSGYLEIDHLTLKDSASDSASFVFTTNTVLHIHDVSFYGTAAASNGVSAKNDAIILGGTSQVIDGTATAPFQGYGTVIRDCFFNNVKRAIVGQTYCNAVQIVNNTVWNSCGYATGGAFEFTGVSGSPCTGVYLAGNLFEVTFYKYGIRQVDYCTTFTIVGNTFFDNTSNTTAFIRFETANCQYNLVIHGYASDAILPNVSDVAGNSTVIQSHQSQASVWAQPQQWINNNTDTCHVYKNPAASSSLIAPVWIDGSGNEMFVTVSPSVTFPKWSVSYKGSGGAAEECAAFIRLASDQKQLTLVATLQSFIDNPSGDLKIRAKSSGGSVWIGDASTQAVRVTGKNLYLGSNGSLIANYNGIATVSNGVPAEYAAVDLTGQGAAVATATLYAVPSTGAGQYRISWNAKVTRAATTSSTLGTLTITYTDPDGVVQTITMPAHLADGSGGTSSGGNVTTTVLLGVSLVINVKASTNIQYAFAYASSGATGMQYNLHVKVEAL